MWPRDPELRRAAFELYDSVWPFLAPGIRRARKWGSDWFEVSTPFLVTEGQRVLAHVGVVTCDFSIAGHPANVAAVHAVCVHPDYQGQGLGRRALEDALEWIDDSGQSTTILWSEKVDFYRRFGFEPLPEAIFRGAAPEAMATQAQILNPHRSPDLATLRGVLESRKPISEIAAAADRGWHFLIDLGLSGGEQGELLWLPEHRTIAVLEMKGSVLHLYDLLCEHAPPVSAVVGAAQNHFGRAIDRLEVYFTPDRLDVELESISEPSEDLLQLRGDGLPGLSDRPFAFSPFSRT